jgi:type I restriction enzyme M protein
MSDSEVKISEVGRKAQENANLIWNAANSLFGAFKPHEYGLVILPMCVIKRFHDCLAPTKMAVLDANKKYNNMGPLKAGFLKKASGYQFYNTSDYTFERLKSEPDGIYDNFMDFIHGFSDNVNEILIRMNFFAQIERMKETKVLYQIIVDFSAENLDMSPERISTVDMGYIFENLVQRFSESYDEDAGAHFTSRDIIYLMCDLLTHNSNVLRDEDNLHCTVYDMAMGTSQMLTCMEERLKEKDAKADVKTFGQEINPFTMGIAAADTLIHGGDPDNMKFGNTLSDDKFSGYKFDFVISNPPFGIDWKREAAEVEKEHKKGEIGRFAPGLPGKNDGQMLFLLNGIAKLKDNSGKMAIIQNGSSLFTGDAGSGQSEIRKYIIENDWLDAIIQLPNDSFYNTDIATYVWIIDKSKPVRNPGKVQLIDASKCCVTRRKPIGKKRVDIIDQCKELIVKAYNEYRSHTYKVELDNGDKIICRSKVLDSVELGYYKVVMESPLLNEDGSFVLKKNKKIADTNLRDTTNIPLSENIDEYLEREILPYNPGVWIDDSKTKIGYEIPFTRTFYEYKEMEVSSVLKNRIKQREQYLMTKLHELFGGE